MMSQNMRSRRPKDVADTDLSDIGTPADSIATQLLRCSFQISLLGLISIAIFYGVRFAFAFIVGVPTPSSTDSLTAPQTITSDDLDDLGLYWMQPQIALGLIPRSIATVSSSVSTQCTDSNPEWTVQTYTWEEAYAYIERELGLDAERLTKLKAPLDLFKYHFMNKNGGFYVGKNADCHSNLDLWLEYWRSASHVHYNNYVLPYDDDNMDQAPQSVELDMIIGFTSSNPYTFSNLAFFTKPNNPILQFILDAYLEYLSDDNKKYVGPEVFTDTIRGFVDTFTVDPYQALTFHKFEHGKGHIVTLYLDLPQQQMNAANENENMIESSNRMLHILVVPLPQLQKIAKKQKPGMRSMPQRKGNPYNQKL